MFDAASYRILTFFLNQIVRMLTILHESLELALLDEEIACDDWPRA